MHILDINRVKKIVSYGSIQNPLEELVRPIVNYAICRVIVIVCIVVGFAEHLLEVGVSVAQDRIFVVDFESLGLPGVGELNSLV